MREQLKAYLDGELTMAERQAVEQALSHDASLRMELDDLRAISQVLQTEAVSPTASGLEQTLAALRAAPSRRPWWVDRRWSLAGAAASLALAAFLLPRMITFSASSADSGASATLSEKKEAAPAEANSRESFVGAKALDGDKAKGSPAARNVYVSAVSAGESALEQVVNDAGGSVLIAEGDDPRTMLVAVPEARRDWVLAEVARIGTMAEAPATTDAMADQEVARFRAAQVQSQNMANLDQARVEMKKARQVETKAGKKLETEYRRATEILRAMRESGRGGAAQGGMPPPNYTILHFLLTPRKPPSPARDR